MAKENLKQIARDIFFGDKKAKTRFGFQFNITSKMPTENQQITDHLLLNSYSSPYQHILISYKRKS